jgi:hypothetical protein
VQSRIPHTSTVRTLPDTQLELLYLARFSSSSFIFQVDALSTLGSPSHPDLLPQTATLPTKCGFRTHGGQALGAALPATASHPTANGLARAIIDIRAAGKIPPYELSVSNVCVAQHDDVPLHRLLA